MIKKIINDINIKSIIEILEDKRGIELKKARGFKFVDEKEYLITIDVETYIVCDYLSLNELVFKLKSKRTEQFFIIKIYEMISKDEINSFFDLNEKLEQIDFYWHPLEYYYVDNNINFNFILIFQYADNILLKYEICDKTKPIINQSLTDLLIKLYDLKINDNYIIYLNLKPENLLFYENKYYLFDMNYEYIIQLNISELNFDVEELTQLRPYIYKFYEITLNHRLFKCLFNLLDTNSETNLNPDLNSNYINFGIIMYTIYILSIKLNTTPKNLLICKTNIPLNYLFDKKNHNEKTIANSRFHKCLIDNEVQYKTYKFYNDRLTYPYPYLIEVDQNPKINLYDNFCKYFYCYLISYYDFNYNNGLIDYNLIKTRKSHLTKYQNECKPFFKIIWEKIIMSLVKSLTSIYFFSNANKDICFLILLNLN